MVFQPRLDKTNKMSVRPAKTQISLGIRPVWSESSLSAWRKLGSLAIHSAHSEDSDQTGWMPRLIWVFAGRTLILLVLSCRGSFFPQIYFQKLIQEIWTEVPIWYGQGGSIWQFNACSQNSPWNRNNLIWMGVQLISNPQTYGPR